MQFTNPVKIQLFIHEAVKTVPNFGTIGSPLARSYGVDIWRDESSALA